MKKSLMRIVAVILSIGMLTMVCAIPMSVSASGNPLKFGNDGKFKIVIFSDVQDQFPVHQRVINIMRQAIARENPDFVVFLGDITEQNIKDPEVDYRRTVEQIFAPVVEAGIPYGIVFGNHDDQCGVSNAEQAKIYAESPLYGGGDFRDPDDRGTYRIPLYGSNGHAFDVYLIDSNGQESATGAYLPVKEEQLAWFKAERTKTAAEDDRSVPALVFQHIPVPEYYDVLRRVEKGTKGAVEAFYKHAGEYYVLPDEAIRRGDFMLESPAAPDENTGELDALTEKGDVLGVWVGHDHINSFSIEHRGLLLGYTRGCGFHTYGPGGKRGVRVFKIPEDDPRRFETYTVTMDELCSYRPAKPLTEFVMTHAPSSPRQVLKYLPQGILLTGAATALSIGAALVKKKK